MSQTILEFRRASEAVKEPPKPLDGERCPYADAEGYCSLSRRENRPFLCTGYWPYGCGVYIRQKLGGADER